ncbi:MAG TPA: hypothetical protein PKD56_05065 [Chitinophagales bacterium]|nr:hypothetical protein [Chitinophagales bacterium]
MGVRVPSSALCLPRWQFFFDEVQVFYLSGYLNRSCGAKYPDIIF